MPPEKKLWFKAKTYGWGWTPAAWQGWIINVVYILSLVRFALNDVSQHSASDFLLSFGFDFLLVTIPFLIICYAKGEKPHWSWGKRDSQVRP